MSAPVPSRDGIPGENQNIGDIHSASPVPPRSGSQAYPTQIFRTTIISAPPYEYHGRCPQQTCATLTYARVRRATHKLRKHSPKIRFVQKVAGCAEEIHYSLTIFASPNRLTRHQIYQIYHIYNFFSTPSALVPCPRYGPKIYAKFCEASRHKWQNWKGQKRHLGAQHRPQSLSISHVKRTGRDVPDSCTDLSQPQQHQPPWNLLLGVASSWEVATL